MTDLTQTELTPPAPADAGRPDLLLVHAALEPWAVRKLLPRYWPDGDLGTAPAGYREVDSPFPGLHAFLGADCGEMSAVPCVDLLPRVRDWVDAVTERWEFGQVFAAGGLNFWAFLRDRMIVWLHQLMYERMVLEALAGKGECIVLAAGLDPYQRILLRVMAELPGCTIRPEICFAEAPAPEPPETVAERRFRKGFFLLQDAWHGITFLLEDLLIRRPKVLFVSHSKSWGQRKGLDGTWARTDLHLEATWREARGRPLRIYYRSDSYHPEVGAMTAGRLPPTYLRHFLFILAQTSRGYRETRRIQHNWRRLRDSETFRESLIFAGLSMAPLVIRWLDMATTQQLPQYVRDTRRETHFLRGIRPAVILLTHELDHNRPLLVAAKRLGIPTVAMQLRPHQQWDDSYLAPAPNPYQFQCLPDRLCVFTPEAKARLIEAGAFDPAAVVVTGDPRLDAGQLDAVPSDSRLRRLRRRWGIEQDQKVIAVACRMRDQSRLIAWIGAAVAHRRDAFFLIHCRGQTSDAVVPCRQTVVTEGLRWFRLVTQEELDEELSSTSLLIATTETEIAEGVMRGIPVVRVSLDGSAAPGSEDPRNPVRHAATQAALGGCILEVLAGRLTRQAVDPAAREDYLAAVFGRGVDSAARRVLDAVTGLLQRD